MTKARCQSDFQDLEHVALSRARDLTNLRFLIGRLLFCSTTPKANLPVPFAHLAKPLHPQLSCICRAKVRIQKALGVGGRVCLASALLAEEGSRCEDIYRYHAFAFVGYLTVDFERRSGIFS